MFHPNGLLGNIPTPDPIVRPDSVSVQEFQPPKLGLPNLPLVLQSPPHSPTPPPSDPSTASTGNDNFKPPATLKSSRSNSLLPAPLVPIEPNYVPSPSPLLSTPADGRIPSSNSPSPMRLPLDIRAQTDKGKGKGKGKAIEREKTIGVSTQTARALHESLTSLLGKRSMGSVEDLIESGGDAPGGANGAGAIASGAPNVGGPRAGKRLRPRSKGSKVGFCPSMANPLFSDKFIYFARYLTVLELPLRRRLRRTCTTSRRPLRPPCKFLFLRRRHRYG